MTSLLIYPLLLPPPIISSISSSISSSDTIDITSSFVSTSRPPHSLIGLSSVGGAEEGGMCVGGMVGGIRGLVGHMLEEEEEENEGGLVEG
jgi:hypothetical protein